MFGIASLPCHSPTFLVGFCKLVGVALGEARRLVLLVEGEVHDLLTVTVAVASLVNTVLLCSMISA